VSTQTQKDSLSSLKRDFIAALRIIFHEGLSDAFAHLSVRVDNGQKMLFMPRKSPALVKASELFVVDFDKVVPQSSVHQAVYKTRDDVASVIHFHSPAVILLSVVGQTIQPMHNYSAIFYEGVPVFEGTGQVESPERAGEIAQLLGSAKAIILTWPWGRRCGPIHSRGVYSRALPRRICAPAGGSDEIRNPQLRHATGSRTHRQANF
jgi:ribulose-5-phosphate 4-epimerase/fuculose-1-phosphate aldolase